MWAHKHDARYGYIQTPTRDTATSDCRERGNCCAHSLLLRLEVRPHCSVFQSFQRKWAEHQMNCQVCSTGKAYLKLAVQISIYPHLELHWTSSGVAESICNINMNESILFLFSWGNTYILILYIIFLTCLNHFKGNITWVIFQTNVSHWNASKCLHWIMYS